MGTGKPDGSLVGSRGLWDDHVADHARSALVIRSPLGGEYCFIVTDSFGYSLY